MESGNSAEGKKKKNKEGEQCDGAEETNETIKKKIQWLGNKQQKKNRENYRDWSKIGIGKNDRNGQKWKVSGIEKSGKGKEMGGYSRAENKREKWWCNGNKWKGGEENGEEGKRERDRSIVSREDLYIPMERKISASIREIGG